MPYPFIKISVLDTHSFQKWSLSAEIAIEPEAHRPATTSAITLQIPEHELAPAGRWYNNTVDYLALGGNLS
jgi:hypothetical protein